MKGRIWLLVGVAVGIGVGIGKLPYLAGAAKSLTDTAQRIVGTGGLTLIHDAAKVGAPKRVIEGFSAILAVLVPGVTALLCVCAARGTLLLRRIVGVILAILGVAAFFYFPHGSALGVALLAIALAGIALAASGPLVAAPLAGLAGLIGTIFLPRLLSSHSTLPNVPVSTLHEALYATAGSPFWLRVVVLVVALIPFAFAARLVLSS